MILSTVPTRPETPADFVEPSQLVPPTKPKPKPSVLRDARKRLAGSTALATIMFMAAIPAAHASGSSMPWEAPLQKILESVEGPVSKIIAVIIIIVTGLTLAFGDTGGGFRKLIQIVFGLSIAFAASSFFLSFFSFGGGALV
ncbi:TrbC/VIRB2 family protein [Brucella oryzae]|nr:TrbC/VIRB2 family protein [Brucella oryzae]